MWPGGVTMRQRSPSPPKAAVLAHVPPLAAAVAAAAARQRLHLAVLSLSIAAVLLLWAVSGMPMNMRMPMHLHRFDGPHNSDHHGWAAATPGSPATASGSDALRAAAAPHSSSSCATPPDATAPSPFARSCTLLQDACVDQERVIMYGRQNSTQPWQLAPNREHAKFLFELANPRVSAAQCSVARGGGTRRGGGQHPLEEPAIDRTCLVLGALGVVVPLHAALSWHSELCSSLTTPLLFCPPPAQGLVDHRYPLPPLHIRPANVREGAAYLQGQPRFSNCTVPIVWYPFERLNNFAHLFRCGGSVAETVGGSVQL